MKVDHFGMGDDTGGECSVIDVSVYIRYNVECVPMRMESQRNTIKKYNMYREES